MIPLDSSDPAVHAMIPLDSSDPAVHAVHWQSTENDVDSPLEDHINRVSHLYEDAKLSMTRQVAQKRINLYRRSSSKGKMREMTDGQDDLVNSRALASKRANERIRRDRSESKKHAQQRESERNTYWFTQRSPHFAVSLSKARSKHHFKEIGKEKRRLAREETEIKRAKSLWKKTFPKLREAVAERRRRQQQ